MNDEFTLNGKRKKYNQAMEIEINLIMIQTCKCTVILQINGSPHDLHVEKVK